MFARFLLWLACVCTIPLSSFRLRDVCVFFFESNRFTKTDTVSETDGLGPFDVHSLKCNVVADVVIDQKAPMVVLEVNGDGETVHAVVTQKDLRIVCVGCFKEGMTLLDASCCRKCSGFVKHPGCKGGTETSAASTCVGVNQLGR